MSRHSGTDEASHPTVKVRDTSGRGASSAVDEPRGIVFSPLLAAAGIRHGFSTRERGVSQAYVREEGRGGERNGERNLGFTASDTRENVLGNRARLLNDAFSRELPLVTLRQVHSVIVHRVDHANAGESTLSGDGLLTDEAGLALGVQTADCVPVLLADCRTGAVAAFHAGWRGTLGRIVEQGVACMCEEFGAEPRNLLAAIGPAIGPCCYSIGEEVEQHFRTGFRYAGALLGPGAAGTATHTEPASGDTGAPPEPKFHLDLPGANRRQLLDAGLRAEAVDLLPWCTRCRNDLFFSYRAEQGFTGRMMSVIAKVEIAKV